MSIWWETHLNISMKPWGLPKELNKLSKWKKIEGPTMDFRTITIDELEDDSQVGDLSCMVQLGLVAASFAQMSLLNIIIPLPLEFVYQHLLDSRFISLTPSNLMQPPFPRLYNLDERCKYHGRVIRHSTENCKIFKYQVRKMVSKKLVDFINDNINDRIVVVS